MTIVNTETKTTGYRNTVYETALQGKGPFSEIGRAQEDYFQMMRERQRGRATQDQVDRVFADYQYIADMYKSRLEGDGAAWIRLQQ